MKFLRNSSIKITIFIYAMISIAGIILSYMIDVRAFYLMLAVCILFISIYIVTTLRRYKAIADISEEINRILHGKEDISLDRYKEGELGILQSEIYKMTVRLREQQLNLLSDRKYLADSLADISHQIRTPLTSINILVSMLAEPDITDERRRKLSHDLYSLLDRIEWMINTLLKMSKLDAGTVEMKKERIVLADMIDKSLAPLLVPMELRNQSVEVSADGEFKGDLDWTSEAVTNILKNCMEHTPQGGFIKIQATENVLYSQIVISDNGSGIDKEELPHIFERFYKGNNSGKNNYGIGLALARTIITLQNGTVKAENKKDGGCVFTLRFYKGTV